MRIDPASDKPIFLQIAEGLEDDIFTGIFEEEAQIPSTNEMAAMWKINPHTLDQYLSYLILPISLGIEAIAIVISNKIMKKKEL